MSLNYYIIVLCVIEDTYIYFLFYTYLHVKDTRFWSTQLFYPLHNYNYKFIRFYREYDDKNKFIANTKHLNPQLPKNIRKPKLKLRSFNIIHMVTKIIILHQR